MKNYEKLRTAPLDIESEASICLAGSNMEMQADVHELKNMNLGPTFDQGGETFNIDF